jgi:hypothetical protein
MHKKFPKGFVNNFPIAEAMTRAQWSLNIGHWGSLRPEQGKQRQEASIKVYRSGQISLVTSLWGAPQRC